MEKGILTIGKRKNGNRYKYFYRLDYLRSKEKSKTILQNLPDNTEVYISTITLFELYMGATNEKKWNDVKNLTIDIPELSFSKAVSEKSAIIYHELRKENKLIDFRDIFIAATSLVFNLPILTLNKKHFARIKGLEIIDV